MLLQKIHWHQKESLNKPTVNYGMIVPLNFVASIEIVVLRIFELCHLYVLPYTIVKNPIKLLEYYKANIITSGYLPPSYIRVLGDKIKDYMKIVFTGSEPANGLFIEGVSIVNNYYMSEIPATLSSFLIEKIVINYSPIKNILIKIILELIGTIF